MICGVWEVMMQTSKLSLWNDVLDDLLLRNLEKAQTQIYISGPTRCDSLNDLEPLDTKGRPTTLDKDELRRANVLANKRRLRRISSVNVSVVAYSGH